MLLMSCCCPPRMRRQVGIVGTWNTSQSCGALGFYTEKIANAGLIGLVFATSPEFVAPHGAKQARDGRGFRLAGTGHA